MNCVSFSPSPNIWVVAQILRSKEYMPQVLWENDDCAPYKQHFIAAMVIALCEVFSAAAAQRQYTSLADMHLN